MLTKPLVTIINNEPTFRWTISGLLESRGFDVETHDRSIAVVDEIRERHADAIVIESSYGSALSATSIVERLRADHETRYIPIIVCSPDGRFLHAYGEFLRGRGCVVVGRPFNDEQFIELVQRVVAVHIPLPNGSSHTPTHQHTW